MQQSISYVEKAQNIIETLLPNWRVLSVEGHENKVCKILDMNCGLDYLLFSNKTSLVYGLASRVQYNKNYRTFTIRKDRKSGTRTEYEKRKIALAVDGITPLYTMQMYVEDGQILGLALTYTKDLIKFIDEGHAEIKRTLSDKIGQAEFYICKWDKMKNLGYTVLEYNYENNK